MQVGLGWGGDWKSPVDKPHLYLPQWGKTTAELKARYGVPDRFIRTWNQTILNYKIGSKYETTKPCYLRLTAAGKKLAYKDAPAHIRAKSTKKSGNVSFRAGAAFRLVEVAEKNGNIWGRMKTGYWVPLRYKGIRRVVPL